jgi:hypothetical protein
VTINHVPVSQMAVVLDAKHLHSSLNRQLLKEACFKISSEVKAEIYVRFFRQRLRWNFCSVQFRTFAPGSGSIRATYSSIAVIMLAKHSSETRSLPRSGLHHPMDDRLLCKAETHVWLRKFRVTTVKLYQLGDFLEPQAMF